MPSRTSNKRETATVVRPVGRGERTAAKAVLGTMHELNRHAPLEEIAPHLVREDPKPWRQASRSYARRVRGSTRRNAGRDDGRTWVSRRYVCGAGMDAEWDDEDERWDLATGRAEERGREPEVCLGQGLESWKEEVSIMEIARPMRARGPERDYEMVGTVPRVIALDDNDQWGWEGGDAVEDEDEEWEAVEVGELKLVMSYATALQQQLA